MLLTDFFRNDLAEHLGCTLLHSLWQGAAVAALLTIVLAVLRRWAPQVRYVAAAGALVLLVAAVCSTFLLTTPGRILGSGQSRSGSIVPNAPRLPSATPPPDSATPRVAAVDRQPPPDAPATAGADPTARGTLSRMATAAFPFVAAVWLCGVLLLSVWHFGGWVAVQRLRVLGVRPAGNAVERVAQDLSRRLRLRGGVRVVQSVLAQTPMVTGWLRPVVLLPASAVTGLSPAQLRGILAHELAHVRRCDYLVNLLQVLLETLLFYHPGVWWMSSRMRLEREQCCDDIAASLCGDARAYAESLAVLEEMRGPCPAVLGARGSGARQLTVRIRRLLGLYTDPAHPTAQPAVVATLLLLASLLILYSIPAASLRAESPALQPATQPSVQADLVGPVRYRDAVEQLLPAAGPEQAIYLNFETGVRPVVPKVDEDVLTWARQEAVDLRVRRVDGELRIEGLELFAAFGRKDQFDAPADPMSELEWFGWPASAARPASAQIIPIYPTPDHAKSQATVVFQTRSGCIGQLSVAPLEGGRLRLRYKVLEGGLAGGKAFTTRLAPLAARLAALEQLKRRALARDLTLLLHLNGHDEIGIEKLGDAHPGDSSSGNGIGEVAQVKSSDQAYTAVVGRLYPPTLNPVLVPSGVSAAYFFDRLGGLVGKLGGGIGPDGINVDNVYFQTVEGQDPWCLAVERFEQHGVFPYRRDVYLIEPGFPLAVSLRVPPDASSNLAPLGKAGEAQRYGFIVGDLSKIGPAGAAAGVKPDQVVIEWDAVKHRFRGPATFSVGGKPLMEVDRDRSTRFEVAEQK